MKLMYPFSSYFEYFRLTAHSCPQLKITFNWQDPPCWEFTTPWGYPMTIIYLCECTKGCSFASQNLCARAPLCVDQAKTPVYLWPLPSALFAFCFPPSLLGFSWRTFNQFCASKTLFGLYSRKADLKQLCLHIMTTPFTLVSALGAKDKDRRSPCFQGAHI